MKPSPHSRPPHRWGSRPGHRALSQKPVRWALLGALLLLAALWVGMGQAPVQASTAGEANGMLQAQVKLGDVMFEVDVADSPALQERGLGGREALGPTEGMLFPYFERHPYAFWMKGMVMSIDMLWIDGTRIVHIEHNVPFWPADTPDHELPSYRPPVPANAVLEIAAGRAQELGVKVGDRVNFYF